MKMNLSIESMSRGLQAGGFAGCRNLGVFMAGLNDLNGLYQPKLFYDV